MPSEAGSAGSGVDRDAARGVERPAALAEELTGRLLCASCRYDLRGLSVKARCPECGLPVQATLLSIVDPLAAELRPISRPRLVAAGLAAWAIGATVAVLAGWVVWLSGMLPEPLSPPMQSKVITTGAVALIISAAGSLAIIRPHGGIPRRKCGCTACAVALYPLVIWAYVKLGRLAATGPGESLLAAWTGEPTPARWRAIRLGLWLMLAAGAWLLRGNLRMLAARSLVLRAQRVDRQTVVAVVASLMIAAVGDAVGLAASLTGSGLEGTLVLLGEVLVVLGASLLTLGMVGITIDTLRLLPAVIHRPLARSEIVTPVGAPARSAGGD